MFSAPLPLILIVADSETGQECGVERLTLYILVCSYNTIQRQSLHSTLLFRLLKCTVSWRGSGTLNTTVIINYFNGVMKLSQAKIRQFRV